MRAMKKIFLAALLFLFPLNVFFAAASAADVDESLNSFSENLNASVMNAATQQNVYAEAWIGKLFPSTPPHFGAGFEFGVSKLDLSPLNDVLKIFDAGSVPGTLVFPTITGNFRLGGFVLPFDFGFSFMYLNLSEVKMADGIGLKYLNLGGDFRWAILKGEGALPQLSVGAGYYYTGGKVSYDNSGLSAGLEFGTHTVFLQTQLSKTLIFFTPYLGLRGIFAASSVDWNWNATSALATKADFPNTRLAGSGSVSTSFFADFIPQLYGGFGLRFGGFALNLGGSYDFRNSIWGADLSLRFQL